MYDNDHLSANETVMCFVCSCITSVTFSCGQFVLRRTIEDSFNMNQRIVIDNYQYVFTVICAL